MGLALLPRAQLTVGLGSVWVTSSVPLDVTGVLTHTHLVTPGLPEGCMVQLGGDKTKQMRLVCQS